METRTLRDTVMRLDEKDVRLEPSDRAPLLAELVGTVGCSNSELIELTELPTGAERLAEAVRELPDAPGDFASALEQATRGDAGLARAAFRARAVCGPVADALACLAGCDGCDWLEQSPSGRAAVRLRLLNAGDHALSVPALAEWVWGSNGALTRWVCSANHALADRGVAASLAAVAADGLSARLDPPAADATFRALIRLFEHPEPAVWIPAARALGRLVPFIPEIASWLEGRIQGDSPTARRTWTAIGSIPGGSARSLFARLSQRIARDGDPWALGAIGPALPFLVRSDRVLFERFLQKLQQADSPVELSWAAVRGLGVLVRRGDDDRRARETLERVRERARSAKGRGATEAQMWREVVAETDFLLGLEPAADDVDRQLRALTWRATERSPRDYADRAVSLLRGAGAIYAAAVEELDAVTDTNELGAALARAESAARGLALGAGFVVVEAGAGDCEAARRAILSSQSVIDATVRKQLSRATPDFPLHRLALRALAWSIDTRSAHDSTASRSELALDALDKCARVPWLMTPNKRNGARFAKAIVEVAFRLRDATAGLQTDGLARGSIAALGAVAPLAPPLALVASGLDRRGTPIERSLLSSWQAIESAMTDALAAEPHELGVRAEAVLTPLGLGSGCLARTLAAIGAAILSARFAAENDDEGGRARTTALRALAQSVSALVRASKDPVVALSSGAPDTTVDAARRAGLLRASELSAATPREELDVIVAGLLTDVPEPLRAVIGAAALQLLQAMAGSRPSVATPQFGPYRCVRTLGSGAFGVIWEALDTRFDRTCVVKLPNFTPWTKDTLRERMLDALRLETDVLRSIDHPNVARFLDAGIDAQRRPYLVIERLVGADLDTYVKARRPTVAELKPIVTDVANGLRALHRRGLVHRDLKPENVFLRIDLGDDSTFDAAKHRDASVAPLLLAVVIDFGIAERAGASNETNEISGTMGFIAPEQAHGHASPASDVYALAATVYAALTGKPGFFGEVEDLRARLLKHATVEPLAGKLDGELPRAVVELLHAATKLEPSARIDLRAFADAFDRA